MYMISYSRSDWPTVEPIVEFLKAQGIEVWLDIEQIEPPAKWREELLLAPKNTAGMICFLSQNYIASELCRMELYVGRAFERPIFPVMLEECWDELETQEETKHLGRLFAARLGRTRLAGYDVTREEILNRLVRAVKHSEQPVVSGFNVYVSYPNGSADFATYISRSIECSTIRPWIATLNCEIGEDWRQSQTKAMAGCKVHVVVISEHLLQENNVLRTEIFMSEAFDMPAFCVASPTLSSDPEIKNRVYVHLGNSQQTYRRLVEHQWYSVDHIPGKLCAGIRQVFEGAKLD